MSKKIVNVKKIPKSVVGNCLSASKKLEVIEKKIEKRITYIVKKICELCGTKSTGWSTFDDTAMLCDVNVGWFCVALSTDVIAIDFGSEKTIEFVMADGETWSSIDQVMPLRWLHTDFEQEVIDGIAEMKKQNAIKEVANAASDSAKINKILKNKKTTASKKKELIKAILK
jgi:hypothetical protein